MAVKQNTVILRTTTPVLAKEGIAGGAVMPGHLIQGPDSALVVHATAGGNARKAFAVEYDPSKEIDDAYAEGDQLVYVVFKPGEEVLALVAAAATAIAEGDPLESAGDGTLRKHTPVEASDGVTINTSVIVAYARQAVDNSAGDKAVRIAVEVA